MMSRLAEAMIIRLYHAVRARMRARWDRDLPMGELLFDRWERARNLGFGPESSVYHHSYFYGDVVVGKHVWIGPFTFIDGSGGRISIGDHVAISSGVHIYTHDTVKGALSMGAAPREVAPVTIGPGSYVGAQTVILKGVTIGERAVIGANSLVNRDVPSYTVAVGVPCRRIGRVEIDDDGAVRLVYDSRERLPDVD